MENVFLAIEMHAPGLGATASRNNNNVEASNAQDLLARENESRRARRIHVLLWCEG